MIFPLNMNRGELHDFWELNLQTDVIHSLSFDVIFWGVEDL